MQYPGATLALLQDKNSVVFITLTLSSFPETQRAEVLNGLVLQKTAPSGAGHQEHCESPPSSL